MADPSGVPSEWAESWQRSWDQLEEGLIPDRERKISVLLDLVEAMTGTGPTVIDLACGPGTMGFPPDRGGFGYAARAVTVAAAS